ncbi:MAG: 3-hydroxyacyl-ACP dehydratase FabZ [Rickettsiales bacterium]|jgi:3-hydroxyacyl-[acyl-carrier-protein] dehydratase|nr:3-hydroxyacyl-ACP dehydratase FabZ [Rickettsiales bacterium]
MQKINVINIIEIMELIPHRYPFLLLDLVVDFVDSVSCVGIKNLTFNESFFQGHFVGNPIMPGVLIVEAMAQTASVLISKSIARKSDDSGIVLFTAIEGAKFRKSVVPGDRLELRVRILNHKMNLWCCEGIAVVSGGRVAEARFSAMLTENRKAGSI